MRKQNSPPKKIMNKILKPKSVDAYIATAPKEVQSKLKELKMWGRTELSY